MTAQSIGIFTIDFPNPDDIDYDNNKFNTLNSTLGFEDHIQGSVQTLSTKDADPSNDPYGLLFVPDLQTDACRNLEKQYVPANATRLHDLPMGENYALIAFTPWFNATCMTEYFEATRQQNTTKAVMVYQPGKGNAKPPVLNDPSWDLNDGGAWQTANTFPTYAISGVAGSIIMNQLNNYSTNLTDVPNGRQLAGLYNTTDYIRLWASIDTDTTNQLPSLWVFLVIVMAILLVAVTATSVSMHVIQRRRRRALQQRVIDGEVDLEALGVKRLNVSQQVLDKLPIYTYTTGNRENTEKTSSEISDLPADRSSSPVHAETNNKISPTSRPLSEATLPANTMSTAWSQPTCPICLDDFVVDETRVRELPCHHVYHPECIDTFLLRNSSLCPLCKQSVLPKGDCPVVITNVMVRRERHITRMRQRSANNAQQGDTEPSPFHSRFAITSKIVRLFRRNRTATAPSQFQPATSDIEMANAETSTATAPTQEIAVANPPPTANTTDAQQPPPECETPQDRREWANQRALALLGQGGNVPPSEIEDDTQTGPKWKRVFRKIFPGFR